MDRILTPLQAQLTAEALRFYFDNVDTERLAHQYQAPFDDIRVARAMLLTAANEIESWHHMDQNSGAELQQDVTVHIVIYQNQPTAKG